MSFVYCVAQLSFHAHDPLMTKLKGLSLIHVQIMKAVLFNHISKVNPHVRLHFLTTGYC